MRRSRWGRPTKLRIVLVAAALSLVALQAPALAGDGPTTAGPGSSTPTPESSEAGDGPVVVEADPFSMDAAGLAAGQIELTTVSTRPNLVTGNEARLQVRGLQPDDSLTLQLNGADVSAGFVAVPARPGQSPGIKEGLLSGLNIGPNRVLATASDERFGTRSATLTVIDHPTQGPVISGPHQEPFVCGTVDAGLGPPGPDCSAPAVIGWYARMMAGQWQQLSDPYGAPPSGTEYIQSGGRSVPFIVRIESVVINRSITRIAVLDNPRARGPNSGFVADEWNHNLLYQFGESCGTGFHQGSNQASDAFGQLGPVNSSDLAGPVLDLTGHLQEGWMFAESTLTTFGVSCNPLTSAETLMMVKEHIVNEYGDVFHTVGAGASGGALQQYLAANNYPGLIDAGTPLLSFPDIMTTAMTVTDCGLLNRLFASDPNTWTVLKQNAITGEDDPQVCQDWQSLFLGDLNPSDCPSGIPSSQVYDPKNNPNGVRCDLEDDDVNGLGRDASGRAILPLDNVGVEYGLNALEAGLITPAEFISLNRSIGGFDQDGQFLSQRNRMTPSEASLLYSSGEVTGQGALPETPIIDQSIPIGDLVPALDIHQQVWPYAEQARLRAAGDTYSQAIWSGAGIPSNAIDVANTWLDGLDSLQSQHPDEPRTQLVADSRPSSAQDQCRTPVGGIDLICSSGVARASNPRAEAGGPLAMDNIDCRLQLVQPSDYPSTVTPADLEQIKAVFPQGVCDYSAPPVGWASPSRTWLSVGSTSEVWPPQPIPYPLARSAVPSDRGIVGGPIPTPAPTPTPQALNQLVGPPSPLQDSLAAAIGTISTVVDGLP